jgi:hypothetical protein
MVKVSRAVPLLALMAGACAHGASLMPVHEARVRVLGEPGPDHAGSPVASVEGALVMVRGTTRQVEGGGIYGDVDVSDPGTIRLTLYDSLPGWPLDAPLPRDIRYRTIVYQATVGPLAPGGYDVVVGRYDPRLRLIEVRNEPLHVKVPFVRSRSQPPGET